ncbi:MAG: hypothetical protein JWP65_90 [Ramlibacter sp.]|jgi:hypothetical protein|uniref:hypothetical protein n=1 Tax=Ramlibacter sp. TaxID=1917967 RepID=UPI0026156475|nr:hypothetical protein [Ramlibacter sp.]MDB5749669.1 hypothetical protein [Ramlibacter sp.]
MINALRPAAGVLLRHEMLLVLLLTAVGFGSIPMLHQAMELSWDGLNHHIYLGWTAGEHRFGHDFLAASYQSLQYPYLYWPAYKLAALGASGLVAGLVLAAVQAVIAIPAWLLARVCMPGATVFDAAMRMAAVLLALMTSVILLLLNTTSNDVLGAIPMLWAIALAATPHDAATPAWLTVRRAVLLSGVAAGAAVAGKLSNGPIAILLPLLWLLASSGLLARARLAVLGSVATLLSFFACYGYWGWLLWKYFGNPVYPLYDGYFAAVRVLLGWQP